MARKGRSLELLVASLELLSSNDDCFSVESPAFLSDKHTGQRREIDVLLTHKVDNKVTKIAFECKDYSRPIDVPRLEEFYGKCSSLDVDVPVFVSSSKYYAPCIPKAAALNIILHSIEQSVEFDWMRVAGLLEDFIQFKKVAITDSLGRAVSDINFVDSKGGFVGPSQICTSVAMQILRRAEYLKTRGDESDPNSLPENQAQIICTGLRRPFPSSNPQAELQLNVSVVFVFSRIFTSFGYFSYKRTRETLKFVKVESALRVDDKIETLVYSDGISEKVAVFGGVNQDRTSIRSFRRFVSWDALGERLFELWGRHLFNISCNSDTLTLSAFTFSADSGVGDWDGVDHWPALKEDGCAGVSNYEEHDRISKLRNARLT